MTVEGRNSRGRSQRPTRSKGDQLGSHHYPRRRFLSRALAVCACPARRASRGALGPGCPARVRGPIPQRDLRARAELLSRLDTRASSSARSTGPDCRSDTPPSPRHGHLRERDRRSINLLDPHPGTAASAIALDRERLELARQLGAMESSKSHLRPLSIRQGTDRASRTDCSSKASAAGAGFSRTGVAILLEPLTRKETHYMNLQGHGARIIEAVGRPASRCSRTSTHADGRGRHLHTLERFGEQRYVHMATARRGPSPVPPFDYRPGFRALKRITTRAGSPWSLARLTTPRPPWQERGSTSWPVGGGLRSRRRGS